MSIYIYIYIYIYVYVFDISILKSFDNAYHKKIILETYLLIKSIFRFLQKLCQYNKNFSKHLTKINTAFNTNLLNYERTESSKV